jgi:hypothetical protein
MTRINSLWKTSPRKVLAAFGGLMAAAALAVGSGANFNSTSANPSNVFTAGTSGSALLSLTNAKPGATFSGTPSAGSSTGFTADSANYLGQGAGVIYSGTLASWPSSSAGAQLDPISSSPATWNAGNAHGHQLQVTVQGNNAGQGLTGSETFTFEANNT